ncbi:MAG: DUF4286 family protein [Crocinitomicaceae bacterium]|nr:DUF4286 family protein [Crocinitomicaceae bacterium]
MNKVLYNVTVSVDEDVHKEWLEWMKEVHIPDVMRTGMFIENRICRVHAYEDGGITYAVQYLCRSMEDYNLYQSDYAGALQQKHTKKFGKKCQAFRTLLEILYEQKYPFADINPN